MKQSQGKWILGIGVCLILGISVYVIRERQKTKKSKPTASSRFKCVPDNFPIQYGSCGEKVKVIQAYLNKKGAKLIVDGKWGSKTASAIQKFMGVRKIGKVEYSKLT